MNGFDCGQLAGIQTAIALGAASISYVIGRGMEAKRNAKAWEAMRKEFSKLRADKQAIVESHEASRAAVKAHMEVLKVSFPDANSKWGTVVADPFGPINPPITLDKPATDMPSQAPAIPLTPEKDEQNQG